MEWLLSVYIAAAVFGVGVKIVEMAGMLGHHDDDGDDSHGHDNGHHEGGADDHFDGHSGDHSGNHSFADDHADFHVEHGEDSHAGYEHDHDEGFHSDHHDASDDAHINAGDEKAILHTYRKKKEKSVVLKTISILRFLVYFCLGFGGVGLFALLYYKNAAKSLYYSIPSGLVVMLLVILIRKSITREIDSHFKEEEFLMESATVIASIKKNSMGKIRINYGSVYQDRYARAKNPDEIIPLNSEVVVVDITDECMIVEKK